MSAELSFHWRNLGSALLVGILVWVGAQFGGWGWAIVGGAVVFVLHLVLLPRWAARRRPRLERHMLAVLQREGPEPLLRIHRGAWFVRLYSPGWYNRSREGWIRMAVGQDELAERLLERAVKGAPEPHRSTCRANLATVKSRLGKHDDARRIRARIHRTRPELREFLDDPEQTKQS